MMGTPAVALDPNAPSPQQKALAGQPKGSPLEQAMGDYRKATDTSQERYGASEDKYSQRLSQLDKADDAMGAPPPMKETPAPKEQVTSPEKAWGSMAMLMAVIGSAFTRTPLTTAMNAAASAIKAFHQGDEEQFDHAYKTWQVANENARTAWEYQQKVYENILAHHDRERTSALRDKESEDRVTAAQLRAAATSLNDARMIAVLGETEHRDDTNAVLRAEGLNIQRGKAADQHAKTSAALDSFGAMHQAMADWTKKYTAEHGGKAPPAEAQLKKRGELMREMKGGTTLTGGQAETIVKTLNQQFAQGGQQSPAAVYRSAHQNMEKIKEAINEHGGRGVIPQGTVLDAYVQELNNNRAVRQFLVKLFDHNQGWLDRATSAWTNAAHGGNLSPQMVKDIYKLADGYEKYVTTQTGQVITGAQWMAHQTPGVNPNLVTIPDYRPPSTAPNGNPWPQPSEAAIKHLRETNDRQDWIMYDETFGPGSAVRDAGEDPSE